MVAAPFRLLVSNQEVKAAVVIAGRGTAGGRQRHANPDLPRTPRIGGYRYTRSAVTRSRAGVVADPGAERL